MNQHIDIDFLIRNILNDLSVKTEPVRTEPIVVAPPENEVFLDSRVVSLADIKSRLGEAKKLVISPKSVLTPSAKDEIRKRKIEVAVKLPHLAVDHGSTLWFAAQTPAVFPATVTSRFNTKPESIGTVAAVIEAALKRLSNKNRGVALSRQAATLLCEANRHQNIRAISGFEPKQTADDAIEIDANLLVLHPERIGNKISEIIDRYANR